MTAASGDPGEKPHNEGGQEAPPIEQMPAYGGYDAGPPPVGFPPAGPGYPPPTPMPGPPPLGGYPSPPSGFPPSGFTPSGFTPPGFPPPPEYGAPYPGGYGFPAAPPAGTNSLAIFSLVASVIGLLCGIGSIIGIVLGAVALGQIKRTGQSGYGLAVAGIAVGVASLFISVVWLMFAVNH